MVLRPEYKRWGMVEKAHIDFETRSACDLRKSGAHKYAKHPSTDIMCLGVAFNDEPVIVSGVCLGPRYSIITRLLDHVRKGGECVAHNSPFELAIWNSVGVRKYGWPKLRPKQTDCTMARAYAMSLPGSLDGVRAAVALEQEKDQKGHRLMMKMSAPKTKTFCCDRQECSTCNGLGEVYTWHEEPDQIERLFSYCATDVEVERAVDKRLSPLTAKEKEIWLLDYQINNRGVLVDAPNVLKARQIVDTEKDRLDEEMRRVTQLEVATCGANVQLRKWINGRGIPTKGVAKNDVLELLARTDLPTDVRAAISIRQEAAKSSTSKLAAMLDRACSDQRLRGLHQYHGSNTGRWAGRGVQTQNFPRPDLEVSEIKEAFRHLTRSPEEFSDWAHTFHDSTMSVISNCLRGFLVAPPGQELASVDFSAIEARVTAWLSGQESVLEIFRTHGLIYEAAAADTYRALIKDVTKPQRMVGKVQILALGFGGGVGALQAMCKAFGIKLEPAFDGLWALADSERRERALNRYKQEFTKAIKKKEPLTISKKEWLASELVKLAWRESNPHTVRYWSLIELAAIRAVEQPGQIFRVGIVEKILPRVEFQMKGSFLLCTLPSGRRLCYPYPKVSEEKTPWDSTKRTLTYKTEDSTTHKWIRCKTYGGSLTENAVQATARDVLAQAMIRVDRAGYPIVMHVHDEIVTEVDFWQAEEQLKELERIVSEVPAWASGLPIAAEGWHDRRYRK